MKPRRAATVLALLAATVVPAAAHPAPFSYVDLRIHSSAIDVMVAAHIFDLAHDLGIEPPERLLDAGFLAQESAAISALLQSRLTIQSDGDVLEAGPWSAPEVISGQPLIRIRAAYGLRAEAGGVVVTARLFPYDPAHQTLVNVYEGDRLVSQQFLDASRTHFERFTDTRRGLAALARWFAGAGFERFVTGYDHVLFVAGLLLLGGPLRRQLRIVAAFALTESVMLMLGILSPLTLPARIVAPAVALSVVYVGVDSLMIRGGRDVRVSIALVFGLVHGFALAGVLGAMDQPSTRMAWSLAAFDAGTVLGALLIVVATASLLSAVRAQSEGAERRIATAGSVLVAAAGAVLFVQRLFFPGGI